MAPKILFCGTVRWAKKERFDMFEGIAEVLDLDVSDRADLFAAFAQGGKYSDIVAIFRDNSVNERIGPFDRELVDALPASVKWVASNGAGYDNVDFGRLKERGVKRF